MVFSSQIFLFIFLPFSLLGYYLIRKDLRNLYLVLISFIFYGWWSPKLLLVLLAFIVINYGGGLLITFSRKKNELAGRWVVALGVCANLFLLGYFKYFNFLILSWNSISNANLPLKNIPFVLGISFFTFSGISYLLDINSGKAEPQKNPLKFALYMSFFPKLIQGPISRYNDINKQVEGRQETTDRFAQGAYRFVIGLAKKAVLADQLGIVVNQIYANPATSNSVPVAWLGAVGYALQIYFDFSGYTDMAIGLAKMFGFDLAENFNYPYISTSITEFWRRWHITLSTWFRDYVFFKLEFKRRKQKTLRQETNTLIVFFLTGLWHGAAWNFIVWGLWHGIFIAIESLFKSFKLKFQLPWVVKWLITMTALLIGWVLFRSPDLKYAGQTLGIMFGIIKPLNNGITVGWYLNLKLAAILTVAVIACVPWKQVFKGIIKRYENTAAGIIFQDASFLSLLALSLIMVMSSSYNSFIYFKF